MTVGYLRVKEALFQRHDARRASECRYNIPMPYGHLYSYRKSLWNTPLRLLILTPWIILGFRSYKRAQGSCSSSVAFIVDYLMTLQELPIFRGRFTQIWYCAVPCPYFLSLQPEYFMVEEKSLILLPRSSFRAILADCKDREKILWKLYKNIRDSYTMLSILCLYL